MLQTLAQAAGKILEERKKLQRLGKRYKRKLRK